MPRSSFASLLPAALLPALLSAQDDTEPPTAEYAALTNPLSAATNFNIETVRGLLLAPDALFSLNTHASTIVRHTSLTTPTWADQWHTVHNPVAITEANGKLLVVGGATWSLVEHDRTNGRVLRHVALPAEPADIVVDVAANAAYVACQGDNVVVRIDLTTFTENAVYPIPAQRPRFLWFDASSEPPAVYVAPALSGNNTTLAESPANPVGVDQVLVQVIDLDTTSHAGGDLPDEDLFRIDTTLPTGSTPPAVLHGAGTLITEHGRNPADGRYWLIGTEAHNGHPQRNSEDEHRGVFANGPRAIANHLGPGARPPPGVGVDLDVPVGGGTKNSATSMSFPFALAFHSSGAAAIAASTSDLITLCDVNGARLFDLPITQATNPLQPPMPAQLGNAIPRDLWWDHASNALLVHLWGWNKVFLYDLNNVTSPPFWLDLGPDPLPLEIQRGRSIFYDATRPVEKDAMNVDKFAGALTCNTCHPGGGMDLLGWNLSDSFADVKDLMVTQSLLSISDTFPYHWRGERNLDHFNGAFVGLIGFKDRLDETPGGELDEFEAFVFSLQAPANRNQHVDRVLTGLAARAGQQVFLTKDPVLFNTFSCAECHTLPGGTNGDRIAEVGGGIPAATKLDVSHLRQLNHKDQGAVTVVVPSGAGTVTTQRARGGFGISHNGRNTDLRNFISNPPFAITATEADEITAFVRQFDQGIAPAAHRAWLVDATSLGTAGATVAAVLLAQAAPSKRWVDVAAIGHETVGGTVRDLRWAYDPATATFGVHDNSVPARTWPQFQAAITGSTKYLFVGLPPANARRYALDPDNDDLTDAQEAALTTPTNARNRDTDGDGYDDGYEVQVGGFPTTPDTPADSTAPALRPGTSLVRDHATATFAKLYAQFTEPVSWKLEVLDPGNNNNIVSITRSSALQREAMIHVHELYPSSPFGGDVRNWVPRLTITDPRGNPATFFGAQFATTDMLELLNQTRLSATIDDIVHVVPPAVGGGSLSAQVRARVRFKFEGGGKVPYFQGRVVVAHVLKRAAGSDTWSVSSNPVMTSAQRQPGFQVHFIDTNNNSVVVPYAAMPGDFVLATIDQNGDAVFSFAHSGLASGDRVRLSIVGVFEPTPGIANTFEFLSLLDWDHPTTPGGATPTVPASIGGRDARGITVGYP